MKFCCKAVITTQVSALTAREYYSLPDSLNLQLFATQWHGFIRKMKSDFFIPRLYAFTNIEFIPQPPDNSFASSKLAWGCTFWWTPQSSLFFFFFSFATWWFMSIFCPWTLYFLSYHCKAGHYGKNLWLGPLTCVKACPRHQFMNIFCIPLFYLFTVYAFLLLCQASLTTKALLRKSKGLAAYESIGLKNEAHLSHSLL